MSIKGLFIGIDRYKSPDISWLNCSKKDATAMHTLFDDTFDCNSTLLTDSAATRSNIEKGLQKLTGCNEEDIVIIYFSGHGSETHELATYDACLNNLKSTALPLEEFGSYLEQIKAKQLICVLDCCFSGGIGVKGISTDIKSKKLKSISKLLDEISGEGRLILTASRADQPAWEDGIQGHGFLTHHLIEALCGKEEVLESGKVVFYKLLDYVSERVTEALQSLGKEQHPTVKGNIVNSLKWPPLKRGSRFKAAFPNYNLDQITENITSLTSHGFPDKIIKTWSKNISKLNNLQVDAINKCGLLRGDHIVVSAPTSSGKTMIGELAAISGAMNRNRTIFLLPMKALVNEKYNQFKEAYGPFGIEVIMATGESNDHVPELMKGQYDICLLTYEKFTNILLVQPQILEQISTLVIDEAQIIANPSRGINLEFLLTLCLMKRRKGIEPQIILLSAVIGDTNGLEKWLNANLLKCKKRPVPLLEGLINSSGTYRFANSDNGNEGLIHNFILPEFHGGSKSSKPLIIPLVRRLVKEGKQVIVFRAKKGEARGAAKYLAKALNLPSAKSVITSLPEGDPSSISKDLRITLENGIAFHNSNLDRDERSVIENAFRQPNSEIRVIVATTTLAMGINTPAEAVIIAGLEHPGKIPQPYTVAEYKNIVGRAGRLGFSSEGMSFIIANNSKKELQAWSDYIKREPESLKSQLLAEGTDPRSLIIRTLVGNRESGGKKAIKMSQDEIVEFLEASFGAYQQIRTTNKWQWDRDALSKSVEDLANHKLIEFKNGYCQLTKLGWLAGQGGVEVESIIRLVDAISSLDPQDISGATLISLAQLTTELDSTFMPVNPKGATKELNTWKTELLRQNIPLHCIQKLINSATDDYHAAARLKKAVACLLWISSLPMEEIEINLNRHSIPSGISGSVRSISSRAHDVILTVSSVAEFLYPDLELNEISKRLYILLETGASSVVLSIAKKIGGQFTRADYQALEKNGLSTLQHLESAAQEDLLTIIGSQYKISAIKLAIKNKDKELLANITDLPPLPIYTDDQIID